MITATFSSLGVLLAVVVLATMASMLACWAWYVEQRLRGRHVFPERSAATRFVPWGFSEVALAFLAFLFVSGFVQFVFLIATGRPPSKESAAGAGPDVVKSVVTTTKAVAVATDPAPKPAKIPLRTLLLLNIVVNAVMLAAVPLLVSWRSSGEWSDLGIKLDGLGTDVRHGALAFLLVTPVVMAVNLVAIQLWSRSAHPVETMLKEQLSPVTLVVAYLAAAVFAPLAEELLFRGLLQSWLRKVLRDKPHHDPVVDDLDPFYGTPPTPSDPIRLVPRIPFVGDVVRRSPFLASAAPVVITSLVFAALHYQQMPAPVPIFALSLALGSLYERTGSLASCVVLHGLFNTFNTTVLVAALTLLPGKYGG